MATEQELSDFLKSVEKRAFKRSMYHVREEEAALDIVQDSMMKLAQHYGDKPVGELPMLFQRILSNATLDSSGEEGEFDFLGTLESLVDSEGTESAQDATERAQIMHEIELHIEALPGRQREAFLMRYWEELERFDIKQIKRLDALWSTVVIAPPQGVAAPMRSH